jgi:hypothetical protein
MRRHGGIKSILLFGALGAGASSLLTGCAAVTAIPLEPDGLTAVAGAQPGFRYYLPRPYLLVAEAPATKTVGGSGGTSGQTGQLIHVEPRADAANPQTGDENKQSVDGSKDKTKTAGAGASANPPSKPGTDGSNNSSGPSAASAPATDTSFQIGDSSKTYIAKLIYLPDYSRPMAVELSTGLVGISKVDMSLQDGWMLTNVSANADNSKMGDVLVAAIQALSTGATGGASQAASAASKKAGALPLALQAPPDRVLRPGLYAFDYNYGMSRVSFLCAVAFFGPEGSKPATGPGACGPDYSRPMPPPVSTVY